MMVKETFSYLKIDSISTLQVEDGDECGFACANNPKCFSYNLVASISVTGKRQCELLPSDRYNNSDKFIKKEGSHHYSIWVGYDYSQLFLHEKCPKKNYLFNEVEKLLSNHAVLRNDTR